MVVTNPQKPTETTFKFSFHVHPGFVWDPPPRTQAVNQSDKIALRAGGLWDPETARPVGRERYKQSIGFKSDSIGLVLDTGVKSIRWQTDGNYIGRAK